MKGDKFIDYTKLPIEREYIETIKELKPAGIIDAAVYKPRGAEKNPSTVWVRFSDQDAAYKFAKQCNRGPYELFIGMRTDDPRTADLQVGLPYSAEHDSRIDEKRCEGKTAQDILKILATAAPKVERFWDEFDKLSACLEGSIPGFVSAHTRFERFSYEPEVYRVEEPNRASFIFKSRQDAVNFQKAINDDASLSSLARVEGVSETYLNSKPGFFSAELMLNQRKVRNSRLKLLDVFETLVKKFNPEAAKKIEAEKLDISSELNNAAPSAPNPFSSIMSR